MRLRQYIHIIFSIIAAGFISCSDDILPGLNAGEDELRVSLAIPALDRVAIGTRTVDEWGVQSITMLTFRGAGSTGVLVQDVYSVDNWVADEDGNLTFDVALDRGLNRANLELVFILNAPDNTFDALEKEISTRSDLDGIRLQTDVAVDSAIPMAGSCAYSDLIGSGDPYVVVMKRDVAAVTATMKSTGSSLTMSGYGMPDSFSITSALSSGMDNAASTAVKGKSAYDETTGTYYFSPIGNNSHSAPFSREAAPFFVVKAPFGGKEYYYRLALATTESDGTEKAYDLLPNHKYEYEILAVKAPGYASEELAASGEPSGDIDYLIYDRQPSIFNMASDGRHELGIAREVRDQIGDDCELEFYVKLYPAPENLSDLTFVTSDNWISVSATPISQETVEDKEGQIASLVKFGIHLDRNPIEGIRKGSVSASWMGLTVTMPVIQERSFIADLHTSIGLRIYESDGSLYREISDYWTFLRGEGTQADPGNVGATLASPRLHGITEEANGGIIRNRGLHFPVMNNYRRYEYTVLPDFDSSNGAVAYKVAVKEGSIFEGDIDYPTGEIPLGEAVKITFNAYDKNLQTEEGTLRLISLDNDGNQLEYLALDVYYTGLFDWSDYPTFRADRTNDPALERAWYYYEVVPFTVGDETIFWLDRNIGARTRGYDILDASGVSIFGEEASFPFLNGDGRALGGIYKNIAEEGVNYDDPTIVEAFGPPGYQLPRLSLFNELKDSRHFITSVANTTSQILYYNAYLEADGGKRIYFPKAGQMQNGVLTSEGRTGHYWTSTAATGFEKEEIGKWLSTLVLSGTSASEGRARINNPNTAMSARLVSKSNNSDQYYQTCLKVQGATHVFLYSDASGSREWASQWPGDPVSSPEIAFDRVVNYVHESSRNVAYKVIFNYVSETGAIITMAASDAEKGINATGWDATGTFIFDRDHTRIE